MGGYIPPAIRARNLLDELGIKQPPTPVEDICNHFDIECDFNAKIEAEALLITGGARTIAIHGKCRACATSCLDIRRPPI